MSPIIDCEVVVWPHGGHSTYTDGLLTLTKVRCARDQAVIEQLLNFILE
jgi:hypothetical protein